MKSKLVTTKNETIYIFCIHEFLKKLEVPLFWTIDYFSFFHCFEDKFFLMINYLTLMYSHVRVISLLCVSYINFTLFFSNCVHINISNVQDTSQYSEYHKLFIFHDSHKIHSFTHLLKAFPIINIVYIWTIPVVQEDEIVLVGWRECKQTRYLENTRKSENSQQILQTCQCLITKSLEAREKKNIRRFYKKYQDIYYFNMELSRISCSVNG